jgi:F-box/leucine-rich repeat protein 2/20
MDPELGKGCPQLQTVNLMMCSKITDAGVMELGKGCSRLQTVSLSSYSCSLVTDAGVMELGKGCPQLQTVWLDGCANDGLAQARALSPNCKFID